MFLSILFTHRKANVGVREEIFKILRDKLQKENPFIKEKVFLVTCYRVESYLIIEKNKKNEIIKNLVPQKFLEYAEIIDSPSLIFEHLVLVASGADSPAIGEPEVQGQVKRAYLEAKRRGWTGKYLGRAFERALFLSKRIRKETELQRGSLSIPKIVSLYIKELKGKEKDIRVLLVGTGEMGIAISRYLHEEKIPFKIATKTKERKEFLEEHAKLDVILYNEDTLPFIIKDYEIIIFATNSSSPLIYPHHLSEGKNPRIIIDLGFPENVSREVKKLNKVTYHGIDEFKRIIEERIKEKEKILQYVKSRVKEESKEFEKWLYTEEKILKMFRFVDRKIKEIIKKNGRDDEFVYEKLKRFFLYPTLKSMRSGKPIEEIIDRWLKE